MPLPLSRLATVLVLTATATAVELEDPGRAGMRDLVARLRTLETLIETIDREHAEGIDRTQLWTGAFRGIAASCDPATRFLGAAEAALLRAQGVEARESYGMDVVPDGDQALVTRVVSGGPADRAGLRCGDLLACRASDVLSTEELATAVAAPSPRPIRLVRTALVDHGVAGAGLLGGGGAGTAYLRIERFTEATPAEFLRLRRDLAAQGARALIIDLRGNPGGSLPAAVACLDGLLDADATVAEQVARNPARSFTWRASVETMPRPVAVAVLVDQGTASAAEVVAAALADHRRGVVVGATTSGKDTVQQQIGLPGGDAILLTVARLRRPGGQPLAGGVVPAVVVATTVADGWRLRQDPGAADPLLERALDALHALRAAGP